MKIKLFTENVQWVSAHMDVFLHIQKIIKNFLSYPNIWHHPYGIGVKGKKDLSSDPVGREGGELTEGSLKTVELVKLPESGWAGKCNARRVLINIGNSVTASFPSVSLKNDSITGFLGHECGHWNFSDFKLRQKYLEGLKKGEWYFHPPKPKTGSEEEHLEEINGYLERKHEMAAALLAETASYIQNMLEDVYVEQKMCERYPGRIRRGIRQNRIPTGVDITVYLNRKDLGKGESVCEIEFRTEEYMEDCNIKDDVEQFHLYLDGEEIEFIAEDIKAYSSTKHCSYFGQEREAEYG